jgi:methylmalonyl-CoA mutase
MSKLGAVVESVEKHEKFVLDQVKRARTDENFGREMTERWEKIKAGIPTSRAPTGLPLPRLALPEIDEAGEIARYLFGDGLPGEFPYLNGAYREMYLEPLEEIEMAVSPKTDPPRAPMATQNETARNRMGPNRRRSCKRSPRDCSRV